MSKRQMFLYPEGYENFVNCADNAKYDYSSQLQEVNTKINSELTKIYNGRSTPSASMDSIAELVQTEIDKQLTVTEAE
jgi:hypothetical protein